jgi:hypothetical protein
MGQPKDSERRYANRHLMMSQLKKWPVKATGHPVSDIRVSLLRFLMACLQHAFLPRSRPVHLSDISVIGALERI